MVYSAATNITIPYMTPSATKSRGLNHLASGSLFIFGQACNHNCTAVSDKNSIKIFGSTGVNITALCPLIIQGHRNVP